MGSQDIIGKHIGDFVVLERIGRGGMATVYRARQPSVNRDVALKVIELDLNMENHEAFRRRFAQEAEVIAKLEHIHILPIYDYGLVDDDLAYLAMRLLRGGSLSQMLSHGPLGLDQTADLFTQFARGLGYAHAHGVIHRDLKPSNILLDDTGNAYLTDFGLAKLMESSGSITKSGNLIGTPVYMSPEQLRGGAIDQRSDIYGLGVILYQMLAGRPPFEATDTNLVSVIYQHLEKAPMPPRELNPEIPDDVEAVILKALEKDPDWRFASADEMANELNNALGRKLTTTSTFPVTIAPTRPTQPHPPAGRQLVRRSRRVIYFGAAALLVLALVAAGLIALLSRQPGPIPPATVIAGQQGSAADSVPTADEVSRAQARLGDHGFIAYITCNQTSEYHATQAREMGDMAAAFGLPYHIYDGNNDKYSQIPLIERARADGVVGLIVCPLDMSLLDESLRSLQSASMPLVMMQSAIPSYGGVLIAGDDYLMGLQAGWLAGQIIAQEMNGQADVIILDYPSLPIIVNRANGLEDGIRQFAPNANIVGRYLGATRENGQASVSDLLQKGVHFDVIASINDAGSFGAIAALEQAHVAPNAVAVVSVDDEALAQQYIRQGHYMRGSVEIGREALSRAAINAMVKLLAGATVPETYLVPPLGVVTKDQLELTETSTPDAVSTEAATSSP